jgi:5-methylcytosine-specific restriction endonuclease McrA
MDIKRRARRKPWIAKKQGRNRRRSDTGELVRPFEGVEDNSFYKTEMWRATRLAVLSRDGVCQWCLHLARITEATEADHVVPVRRCDEEGISPYDKTNIVGSCRSCNARRAAYEAKGVRLNTFDDWVEYLRRKLKNQNK